MYLYTVLDRVAQDTAPVFESKNDGTALRSVAQLFSDPGVNGSPDDYAVMCVAMVEHEPFKLTPFETPRILERIRIKPEYSASNTTDEEVEE